MQKKKPKSVFDWNTGEPSIFANHIDFKAKSRIHMRSLASLEIPPLKPKEVIKRTKSRKPNEF